MTLRGGLALVVAAVFGLWLAAPALASSHTAGGPGAPSTAPGAKGDDKAKDVKGEQKSAKPETTDKKDAKTEKAEKKADKTKAATKPAKKKGGASASGATSDTGQQATTEEGQGSEQGNKGGKVRGLDRADRVAGEHGKQGR